jgi:hypothetical protein
MLVAVTVPVELDEQLDGLAKEREWNGSPAGTEAIRGVPDAKHGR